LGDPRHAKEKLGWVPRISLQELIAEMVAHDLEQARKHALLKEQGYDIAITRE
jgi:GDPmannose 4,6-dehydratase